MPRKPWQVLLHLQRHPAAAMIVTAKVKAFRRHQGRLLSYVQRSYLQRTSSSALRSQGAAASRYHSCGWRRWARTSWASQ
eukprot:3255885-Rhodomonas_salina.2